MEAKSIELLSILLRGSKLLDQKVEEVAKRWQLSLSEAKILSFLCQAPHMNTACSIAKYCGQRRGRPGPPRDRFFRHRSVYRRAAVE